MSNRSLVDQKQKWLLAQIKKYSSSRKKYVDYEVFLKRTLKELVAPVTKLSVIDARAKAIPSFAAKVLKKIGKYKDPLKDMTDLCGARIILQTQEQVTAVCERIKQSFTIDWANSLDAGSRLKTTEFGYRSIHFIVSIKEDEEFIPGTTIPAPKHLFGLRAEIQVRTFLEHSWADFCHDIIYKAQFEVPEKWKREGATLAAMLEQVDHQFTAILEDLGRYATSYGVYLSNEEIESKISQLQFVLQQDTNNLSLVNQMAQMMISLEHYTEVIALLTPYEETQDSNVLNYLGLSLIRQNKKNSREYKKGLKCLKTSMALHNVEAINNYAFHLKQELKNTEVHELYQRAYEISPSNPTCLANYLSYVIMTQKCLASVTLLKPHILKSIKLSRDHADVQLNIPQAFFDMGLFYLLIGQPYESLNAFTRAISLCSHPLSELMLKDCFTTIKKLNVVGAELDGYESVYRLLLIGLYIHRPDPELKQEIMALATKKGLSVSTPVVMLAGGCDSKQENAMDTYREMLLKTFEHFRGTIISGGTANGISKLAGDIKQKYPQNIKSCGYMPAPSSSRPQVNKKGFNAVRQTKGQDFSPLEPLQAWIDLLADGKDPRQVKIIGINGGRIAVAEYRMALAFGASVVIIKGSGLEADKILVDPDWMENKNLLGLPPDMMTLKVFILPEVPIFKNKGKRENIAQIIHEVYRQEQTRNVAEKDPSMTSWSQLDEGYKESNMQQVDHIAAKLELLGYALVPIGKSPQRDWNLSVYEIELLAEFEHGRWLLEKIRAGWRYGKEKDLQKKTNPCLIPWGELSEEEKDKDRLTVKKIPQYLKAAGLTVVKKV